MQMHIRPVCTLWYYYKCITCICTLEPPMDRICSRETSLWPVADTDQQHHNSNSAVAVLLKDATVILPASSSMKVFDASSHQRTPVLNMDRMICQKGVTIRGWLYNVEYTVSPFTCCFLVSKRLPPSQWPTLTDFGNIQTCTILQLHAYLNIS